jgi:hypothetical protein
MENEITQPPEKPTELEELLEQELDKSYELGLNHSIEIIKEQMKNYEEPNSMVFNVLYHLISSISKLKKDTQ